RSGGGRVGRPSAEWRRRAGGLPPVVRLVAPAVRRSSTLGPCVEAGAPFPFANGPSQPLPEPSVSDEFPVTKPSSQPICVLLSLESFCNIRERAHPPPRLLRRAERAGALA